MLQATWSPEMLTGLDEMDELHHVFFDALLGLSSITDENFSTCYTAFVAKAERMFATEDRWMEEIDFPALQSHREQHARVLAALHNVMFHVMGGNLALGRDVIERLLPQWCIFHMTTMDMALAMSIQMARAKNPPFMLTNQWLKQSSKVRHPFPRSGEVAAASSMEI